MATRAGRQRGFLHLQADVSDEPQVKSLFREIKRRYGRLDAAINNAAVASMSHFLLTPAASIEKMLSANVVGTFLVSREAAKLMRKRQYGRIVNFSSLAVPMRLAGQSAYAASKASVESLSQVMARELAEYGITVNVIGPSPIATDMLRGVPKDKIEQLIDSMAVKRLGTFTDVANVLDFFLRRESEAVTRAGDLSRRGSQRLRRWPPTSRSASTLTLSTRAAYGSLTRSSFFAANHASNSACNSLCRWLLAWGVSSGSGPWKTL